MNELLDNPEGMLAELEYEYCLPRWAWTDREWNRYVWLRIWYTREINEYKEYRKLVNRYKDEEDE